MRLAPQKLAEFKYAKMHSETEAALQWGPDCRYTMKVVGTFQACNPLQAWLHASISQDWVLRNWYKPFNGDVGSIAYCGSVSSGDPMPDPVSTFSAVARGAGTSTPPVTVEEVGADDVEEGGRLSVIEEDDGSVAALKRVQEVSLAIVASEACMTESLRWSVVASLAGLLRDFEYVSFCPFQTE